MEKDKHFGWKFEKHFLSLSIIIKRNMEKEFLKYEEALALKELGFDEPCFASYSPFKPYSLAYGYYTYGNCIAAPLYQQAFRWFREKYGLYVSINIHADNMWSVIIKSMTNNSTHTSGSVVDLINKGYSTFKSYEEAELACLVKLIEITKNK